MSADRHYVCPSCRGDVSVPHARRTITLDMVRAAHESSCPGRGAKR